MVALRVTVYKREPGVGGAAGGRLGVGAAGEHCGSRTPACEGGAEGEGGKEAGGGARGEGYSGGGEGRLLRARPERFDQ